MGESRASPKNGDQYGLISAFPSPETLSEFQRNDPGVSERALPRFLECARQNGFISRRREADFAAWIAETAPERSVRPLPAGFAFGDLVDKMAGDRSVNQLVETELNPLAKRFGLPHAQPSMISRLRKHFHPNTPAKRNLLRLLALWIGMNRPHWGWDYETLLGLQEAVRPDFRIDPSEGVRMAFHLAGHGELLEPAAVGWVKGELVESLKHLGIFYVESRRVSAATTTVYLNLPRLQGARGDVTLYARALRDAVALAHQMRIRWDLGAHGGLGNRLVVAIAAGAFADMEIPIQAMLKARLPETALIRMTPFARVCANLSEIKIVFDRPPRDVGLYDGDTLTVWGVECLWSHIYYDYVPSVLEILPADPPARAAFRDSFFAADAERNLALASVYRHIRNTFLIIEIARLCLARGLFHEADGFLSIILANQPFHVVARTVRIVVRLNLALNERDFPAAWGLFGEAANAGRFAVENCRVEDEEVFCEWGQVHFCMARRLFCLLRQGAPAAVAEAARVCWDAAGEPAPADSEAFFRDQGRSVLRQQATSQLNRALECFENGRTLSPGGMGGRSLHWLFRVRALLDVLGNDPAAFDPGAPPLDRGNRFRETGIRMFRSLGWTLEPLKRDGELSPAEEATLFGRVFQAFERYDNSVQLRTYGANVKYAFAILMFDFVPRLTPAVLQVLFGWLDESQRAAEALNQPDSGLRTIVTCFSQVQPAGALIGRIEEMKAFLRTHYAAEWDGDPDQTIERGREIKFTLRNFSEEYFGEAPFF